jgi:alpha 1,3-glucosidase
LIPERTTRHFTVFQNDVNAPFSFAVTYPQAVQLYGVHEHCDTLGLRNTGPNGTDPYRLKNSDVSNYEINSPMALYGAVPVIYGHGYTSSCPNNVLQLLESSTDL